MGPEIYAYMTYAAPDDGQEMKQHQRGNFQSRLAYVLT